MQPSWAPADLSLSQPRVSVRTGSAGQPASFHVGWNGPLNSHQMEGGSPLWSQDAHVSVIKGLVIMCLLPPKTLTPLDLYGPPGMVQGDGCTANRTGCPVGRGHFSGLRELQLALVSPPTASGLSPGTSPCAPPPRRVLPGEVLCNLSPQAGGGKCLRDVPGQKPPSPTLAAQASPCHYHSIYLAAH